MYLYIYLSIYLSIYLYTYTCTYTYIYMEIPVPHKAIFGGHIPVPPINGSCFMAVEYTSLTVQL